MKKYDVVVVGAGPGGYSLAARLGMNGKKVAIIERNKLGGTCVNIGCVPTKSLINSARLIGESKEFEKFGLNASGYHHKLEKIVENAANISKTLNGAIANALSGAGVEVFLGKTAKFIDKHTIDLEGTKISAEKFVIATGSRSNQFSVENSYEAAKVGKLIHSTSALKLSELPKKLVIIGSGIIALEFAYFYSTLGTEVTLLEYGAVAMPAYDSDLREEIQNMLSESKVKILTEVRFEKFDEKLNLVTTIQGKKQVFEADKFFAAVGRHANSELIKGIVDLDQRGNIIVDENQVTSEKHILALGDVTGKKMLSSVAYRMGDAVFQNLMGMPIDKVNVDHIPSSLYLSLDVASVGLNEKQLKDKGIEYKVLKVGAGNLPRMHAEQNTKFGFLKLLIDPKKDALLGAHIILDGASLIINTLALAVSGKIKLKDLMTIGYTHPTIAEAIYYALASHYFGKK
ncbi:dihydrolipoamide dehydrogenase [Mycoplasma testudineum]|uniref:Dihydrolipoamide dehydrogenase n=1 Tax=Mycoplasma testudineum TaxID=244584 RepID=A0A4R6IB26_9MOLU|nr:NAD(P)/FAD-dependent oxidoreductase [Mycoplasma testudineum]TDO19122.1 dihydrolipoamide dehydrogenase [Mycoplasma testudineum]